MSASYINPALPSMIRGLYRADLREKSIQNMLDLAADLVQELIDLRAEQGTEEPEGFYVVPNRDAPDQDSLWDGTIHPTREAAQASVDDAVREWGQDAENYHVVAMVPVGQGDES